MYDPWSAVGWFVSNDHWKTDMAYNGSHGPRKLLSCWTIVIFTEAKAAISINLQYHSPHPDTHTGTRAFLWQ